MWTVDLSIRTRWAHLVNASGDKSARTPGLRARGVGWHPDPRVSPLARPEGARHRDRVADTGRLPGPFRLLGLDAHRQYRHGHESDRRSSRNHPVTLGVSTPSGGQHARSCAQSVGRSPAPTVDSWVRGTTSVAPGCVVPREDRFAGEYGHAEHKPAAALGEELPAGRTG
jgi:hypothetical protein